MWTVSVDEAETTLSRLLDEVERGGTVVIARNGHPVAELRAVAKPTMVEAVEAIRSKHKIRLGGLSIGESIDEGRR